MFNPFSVRSHRRVCLTVHVRAVAGLEPESQPGAEPVGGVVDMKGLMFPSDHRFLLARVVPHSQSHEQSRSSCCPP